MKPNNLVLWSVIGGFLFCFSFRLFFVDPGIYWSSFLCPPLFENSDFENGDLTHWTAKGDAFKGQPVRRDSAAGLVQGSFWVYTYGKNEDVSRGKLVSTPFQIRRDRISFLIGGGNGQDLIGIGLEIGGKIVLLEKSDSRLWTSEKMSRVVWNVSKFKGKTARLVLLDHSAGPWGHLNADDFRYT
jgi:hypothetical protein